MKHIKILVTVVLVNLCLGASAQNNGINTIQIDLNKNEQTMDGFGASDAWRCQMVGRYWPLEKRNAMADLLFSQKVDAKGNPRGIGLSIWRFYLAAGTTEQGDSSKIADEWRRGECFLNPDGTYDWSKCIGQRWFLHAAKQRGVKKFLAFTISPPVQMTQSGKGFADKKQLEMNIQDGKLPEYADYLVNVVDHFKQKEDISFDYLSPINEPQWDWKCDDKGNNSQEGTPATNQNMYDFTKLLSTKLSARSLQTEIVLGEAGVINYLYGNVKNEGRDDQVNTFFGSSSNLNIEKLPNVKHVISGHSYFTTWNIDTLVTSRQMLAQSIEKIKGLEYWMTEYCILEQPGEAEIPGGSGGKRDLGIKTALYVARVIHNDLVVANASSWQWWTAITKADYKDGLIYIDDGKSTGGWAKGYCKNDGVYHDSKLLWALGNYSYFVRPGMIRVEIPDQNPIQAASSVMISAFKNPKSKQLVIVAVNVSSSDQKYSLYLKGNILKDDKLSPYVTSSLENLQKNNDVSAKGFVIPAQSIVTYVGRYK